MQHLAKLLQHSVARVQPFTAATGLTRSLHIAPKAQQCVSWRETTLLCATTLCNQLQHWHHAHVNHREDRAMAGKPLGKILPSETALFVCDVQERFRQVISGMPAVIDTSKRMVWTGCCRAVEQHHGQQVRAADALHMPVLVTEQYPEKLGATVSEINDVIPESLLIGGQRFPKTTFSMMVPEVSTALRRHPHIRKVLLCGIETHVCVLQTALDLLGTSCLSLII